MAIGSTTWRTQWRWWLLAAMSLSHFPAMAMAIVEDSSHAIGYGSLLFTGGALSAILTRSAHSDLLGAYAPNLDALLKWLFRVGVTLIVLELILNRFSIWVSTRQQGETLLGLWSVGRMGLGCYVAGIAEHIRDKKSF